MAIPARLPRSAHGHWGAPGWLLAACLLAPMLTLYGCDRTASENRTRQSSSEEAYAKIEWEQLIPPDELENHRLAVAWSMRRIDHSTDERAPQFGSFKTVAALDGRRVSLTGYTVPLETDDKGYMADFFLVPSVGACIHVPPPPPDQMIYVHLAEPIPAPDLGDAVILVGTLRTTTHDATLASAAYSMDGAVIQTRPPSRE